MGTITSIDFTVLNGIQDTLRCTFLDYVMAFFSYAAQGGIIWIILGAALLCFRKTRAAGVMLLAAILFSWLLGDYVIKPLVQRPRPFRQNPDFVLFIKTPKGYSFPSGHSTVAAAATTVLLATHRRIGLAALFTALLVMFSRLYNYVHFPSDVLCGAVLGVCCALLILFAFRRTGLESKLSAPKPSKA